ncbi:hypothetical protein ACFV2V_07400 [Streptomyces sp. NPDC059698]|uniref:hypothetical protein n=1 Tax=unclassified Streptomyces TaxID=2593676 RepID=UPI00093C503D|nr:hypothetical protein [Streptomyces sp. CB02366]OKJ40944.1 hypothetical protein AMK24_03450 [Streptomyces sp. CB02366]TVP37047.1 hypothetical protein A3L22_00640 [Streptomyces griseus subsp. griseus]WSS57207.1 hypothetical protein OG543_18500 [Streptomyces sp. NBC_01178]
MPTPERAARPKARPTPSALSMKDLLASCAAASAVSTPPAEAARATPRDEADARPQTGRQAA